MSHAAKSPLATVSPRLSQNHHLKSSLDAPGDNATHHSEGGADPDNSYFPQQPSPSIHRTAGADASTPSQFQYTDEDVQANTLANAQQSHVAGRLDPDSETPHDGYANPHNDSHNLAPTSSNNGKFTEEWDARQRGSSIIDGRTPSKMQRSNSFSSNAGEDHLSLPSRGNTLKKKSSLRRSGSLNRSGSRRSMKAGSVRSLALQSTSDPDEAHNAFHCPVPTSGNPTEVLSSRFQTWRKILKDHIAYYREIQTHYETKSKSLLKLANVANNISMPQGFLTSGGIDDAMDILRTYHKNSIIEANKAKDIEEDVVLALTGLRSDLHQKIKEIKSLSGDFKNSVEKEMENTRRVVKTLQDTLGQSDVDPASTTGKQDPYLLRLAVDRQVERQIDEENYLHQAYLNLENSGRELESIVVGEIQKAYNAYAGILKRESDAAYNAIDELRIGPISMPKDREWAYFVQKDDHFVDPDIPVRTSEQIHYPGQSHTSCQEIRAGLLERKSKYLKSYTAGWYVLSATHLHEFKSADKAQAPVMSLYLPEQKLGSHSTGEGSSNKFILKGRQTGTMHRGHTWVFRAETHDTMMAWYEDIKALTEKTPQERSEFVRGHVRSLSQSSRRSFSSDGVVDEEDEEPFSADNVIATDTGSKQDINRPQPGGRFPSDIQVNAQRGLQAPLSPSSVSSGFENQNRAAAAGGTMAGANQVGGASYQNSNANEDNLSGNSTHHDHQFGYGNFDRETVDDGSYNLAAVKQQPHQDDVNPYTNQPMQRSPSQTRSDREQVQYRNQTVVVPVGDMRRSQSRQSQRSQRSQGSQRDAAQRDASQQASSTFAPVPVTENKELQQDPGGREDGVLETPGGNAQYGEWMNGHKQTPSDASQYVANQEYYQAPGDRSGGDVNVAPVFIPGSTQRREPSYSQQQREETQQPEDIETNGGIAGFPTQQQPYGYVAPSQMAASFSKQGQQGLARPVQGNMRTSSHPTISNLHIPGEYPRQTPTSESVPGRVA